MNFTKFSVNKIRWLSNTDEFKESPIRIILKVIKWELFRKKNSRMLFEFDVNLKIYLYPNDGVARLTYYFGYHEPAIFRFLDSFLKSGMVYFDIGANIGLYSLFASKRVGKNGKIFSFEPQFETYNRFLQNIELNNFQNIYAINKGVGDSDGSFTIIQNEDSAKSYITKSLSEENELPKVEVINLDKFLTKNNLSKIDYLKIDVEGFEYNVLLGCYSLLKNNPPKIIQIELYANFLKRNRTSISEVKTYLNSLGYVFFKLNAKEGKLYKSFQDLSGDIFVINKKNINELSKYIIL